MNIQFSMKKLFVCGCAFIACFGIGSAEIHTAIELQSFGELQAICSQSKLPIVVDFYAMRCRPCRDLLGKIDQWAEDLSGKAILCKVNVDQHHEFTARYQIKRIPTVLVLNQDGIEEDRKVGSVEIASFMEAIRGH